MNELKMLLLQFTGQEEVAITELSASGSNRKYYRLQGNGTSIIGVEGTSVDENRAFIQMSKLFSEINRYRISGK